MHEIKAIENIDGELKKYLKNNPSIECLVIGVSGGIDSALCCALAHHAIKDTNVKLIGRSLPITTTEPEMERADLIGEAFCDSYAEINLTSSYEDIRYDFQEDFMGDWFSHDDNRSEKIRNGNIKARLRMTYLYNLASKHSGLVLNTDNTTEYLLGFWTLHGDVGDLGMIQELWKTEVFELADYIANKSTSFNSAQKAAMQSCLIADPTDGLGISGTDLDQIMPGWNEVFKTSREGYEYVDIVLQDKTELYPKFIEKINERHLNTNFKRNNPFSFARSVILKR